MDSLMEISKYGLAGVAVLLAGILFWIVKFMFEKGWTILEKLSKNIEQNTRDTKIAVKANKELYKFMKNLNGELRILVAKKKCEAKEEEK